MSGPNTSCEHTFMSGVTSVRTVGVEHAVVDLAAGRDLRAGAGRLVDPADDAVALAGRR